MSFLVAMRAVRVVRRGKKKIGNGMASEQDHLDCFVIGGGLAGLTSAIYLARYRRNVMVIDSRESRAALIPETHNYPGFADGVSGKKLLELLTAQAQNYGVRIAHGRVEDLQKSGDGFAAAASGRTISAKRVVLA